MAWDLLVDRSDLARTELREMPDPEPAAGQAVLRVDRVGMTANNVTYAVLGDALSYWRFFPAADGKGRVPLWGFAEVVASQADGVEVGQRVYGYLPPSSHLVVEPSRVDRTGFRDGAEHRASLPSPYQAYALVDTDPAYEEHREDLQVLYRPLFMTSFFLADFLVDNGFFGAERVVMSSASSKTAYGAAFLLDEVPVVGLTSARNADFVAGLGCYAEVVTYDDVATLGQTPTVYADLAGTADLRRSVRDALGSGLRHDAVVGVTFQDSGFGTGEATWEGPQPTVFFAPDQIGKRTGEWGRDGVAERFGAAWARFAPTVEGWVDVEVSEGPQALEAAWLQMLSGDVAPRTGLVVQL